MEAAAGILGGVTTSILLSTTKDDDAMPKTPPSAEVSLDGDASPRIMSSSATASASTSSIAKGGVPIPFPWRLHDVSSDIVKESTVLLYWMIAAVYKRSHPIFHYFVQMLDAMAQQDKGDIVSWQPHGRAFLVKDPKAFVEEVMPQYFSQTKVCCFCLSFDAMRCRRCRAGCHLIEYRDC